MLDLVVIINYKVAYIKIKINLCLNMYIIGSKISKKTKVQHYTEVQSVPSLSTACAKDISGGTYMGLWKEKLHGNDQTYTSSIST